MPTPYPTPRTHALAVRGVGDPAGQLAQVRSARSATTGIGLPRTSSSSSATGAAESTTCPVGIREPSLDRVADPHVDRVHAQRRRELVHL